MPLSSEELDGQLMRLAMGRSDGSVSDEQVQAFFVRDAIVDRLDGENIKQMIQMSFLVRAMGQRSEAFHCGWTACRAAEAMARPEINFSLEIGVGDALVCAAYCMSCHAEKEGEAAATVGFLVSGAERLREDGDSKGFVECPSCIASLAEKAGQNALAARYFKAATQCLLDLASPEFFDLPSSQDMVRLTNRNTYVFQDAWLRVPTVLDTRDVAFAVAYWMHRASVNLQAAGRLAEALEANHDALTAFSSDVIFWPAGHDLRPRVEATRRELLSMAHGTG